VLRPLVTVAPGTDPARAAALHREAHARCFIANSVNFPVTHQPRIQEERR
jgi:organic hydroperoxide reductase OsmC/OhrA